VTNHEATLALEGKRVVRVIADNQTFAADKVIIAAGA
jgi:glycine/D-amino acid oxidase-like deaminating enzyme